MLHVLKIGRTLRHYMLPCQTANQHFLHFSKEGGGCGGGNGGGERSRYTMYTIFRIQCWPYYIDAMLVISDRTINFHRESSVSGVHYLYYPPTNFPVMLKMKRRKRYYRWIDQEEHQFLSSHLGVNAIRNRSS